MSLLGRLTSLLSSKSVSTCLTKIAQPVMCRRALSSMAGAANRMLVSQGPSQGPSVSCVGPSTGSILQRVLDGNMTTHGHQQTRTIVRQWYRPNPYKRMKKHGYTKRTSSRRGLIMLWRKYLKGKTYLWY